MTYSSLKKLVLRVFPPGIVRAIRAIINQRGSRTAYFAAQTWPNVFESWHRRRAFQAIYNQGRWGSEPGGMFHSGPGSRGEVVDVYLARMSQVIEQQQRDLNRPVTVVDLGCGDFKVGRQLLSIVPGTVYIGCDIVPELIQHLAATTLDPLISFRTIDIVTDSLPAGDICLVRQVFQHLSNSEVSRALSKLKQYSAVYVTEAQPLIAEGPLNPDKVAGIDVRFYYSAGGRGRGLELDKPPFNCRLEEICRVTASAFEELVTWRLHC